MTSKKKRPRETPTAQTSLSVKVGPSAAAADSAEMQTTTPPVTDQAAASDRDPLTELLGQLLDKATDERARGWLRRMRDTPERASSADAPRQQAAPAPKREAARRSGR